MRAPGLPAAAVQDDLQRGASGYENRMLAITSLTVGVVAFDRLAVGYLAPYLVKAFALSNTQLGALYAVQALAAALAGFAAGRLADLKGWRKQIIVPFLCLMSLFALLSAAARSFAMLAPIRFVLGATEGPVATLNQSITSQQSSPHRRGLNLGLLTLAMFMISQVLSPIVLTGIADRWGWRAAFMAPAAPALILALVAALALRNSIGASAAAGPVGAPAAPPVNLERNVWVCAVMSMVFMSWLVVHSAFLPLYLVKVRGLAPAHMAVLMSLLGVSGCVGSLLYPTISDRVGRKPTMLIAMGAAALVPLALLLFHGPEPILAAILFVGWLSVGALPLYTAVIPGESVSPQRAATIIAMIMGAGELVGGVAGPLVAGSVADRFGLVMPFWFTAAAAIGCCVLAFALKESNVRARARSVA